jgi:hypothetical protein
MKRISFPLVPLALLLLLVACALPSITPETPTSAPPATAAPPTLPPDTPAAPSPTSSLPAPPADRPEEAILILEPGPGSRLVSPLHVAGIADPAFEQTLVVRILLDDGTQLALTPTTIQADIGQRGPFAVDIPFSVASERAAFIQVYVTSARDGGITHLSSVGVRLLPGGTPDIVPGSVHPELIYIQVPTPGATLSGGVAHVEGFGLASFEQTLVVEVYDENGALLGQQPITVNSPDWGIPGPFSADVPYSVASSGPGRIVVRDPSVVFNWDNHLSSVEVTLAP